MSELRGLDPLDVQVADAADAVASATSRRHLSWFGWSASSVPVAGLLLTGMAFGPLGIGLIPPSALAFLDPAVSFATAAFGVLLGLAVGSHRIHGARLLAPAIVEGGATMVIVAIGLPALSAVFFGAERPDAWWLFGALAGVCAATSLRLPTGIAPAFDAPGARVVEFDAVLAIVAGGILLAFVREGTAVSTFSLAVQASLAVVVLATAGWLLLAKPSSETEQRVFTIAMLLLIGGAAEYLALSALFAGVVAGVFWQRAGGEARDAMRRDGLFLQHPLLVLLLIVAGARTEPSVAALAVAFGYVILRAGGKAAGAALVNKAAKRAAPSDLGVQLLAPGVIGVAFALNALQAVGPGISTLFSVVVLGTIGAEFLSGLVDRRTAAR